MRSFTYAASGQVTQDVRDPSDTYAFTYNNNGRSITVKLNGSTVGSYTYNAFEQRVQKVAGGVTTQFVFDRFGHLLEEANGSGTVQKEYIWLDDLPVAMVDVTTNTIYFVHTDQLGTPQKITDGSANVVWDGVYDPFGLAVSVSSLWGSPTQWGSFTWEPTTPVPTNLRFPGQYADAETALNQNWNRDYDPTIGRYIQSDPIGLDSGVNTYGYALNQPLIFIDPTGTGVVGGAIGGIVGGILGGVGGTAVEPGGGTAVGGYEGAEEGYAIGSGIEDLMILMSRAKSDPASAQGMAPVNPGKDCNGNCKPCPPGQSWSAPGNAHGSTSGVHYHGIVWNQNPETCECFPSRVSGATPDTME